MLLEHRDVNDTGANAQHGRKEATDGPADAQGEVVNVTCFDVVLDLIALGLALLVVGLDESPHQHGDGKKLEHAVEAIAEDVNDANANECANDGAVAC